MRCSNHKHVEAVAGKKRCQGCLDYNSGRTAKAITDGFCTYCKIVKAESGHSCDKCKLKKQEQLLKRTHGLTKDQKAAMVKEQDAKCAICFVKSKLHVDHNHKTGEIRDLLCGNCNRALGLLHEDPVKVLSLHRYIMKWGRLDGQN